MPVPPREPDRFCIIPIYSDSTGSGAIPQNAVAHGSWSAITGRIRDSKQQRQMLALINDAEHAKGTLKDIRAREDSLKAAEESFQADVDAFKHELLQDFLQKIDALQHRIDELEAERARDPEDDLPLPTPPGTVIDGGSSTGDGSANDDGDLQSPTAPPEVAEDQKGYTSMRLL